MATKREEPTGLRKLLEDQLADIYYAEKQLVKALPKMAKAANNEELREAFQSHLEETNGQVQRLEQVFEALGIPAKGKKCPAIDGILEEGKELMEEYADDPALDAALVDAGQKAEHYEIATYGSMCAWAEQLGLDEVRDLLNETLEQEKGADEKLTEIAETVVNIEAETADMEEGDDRSRSSNGNSRGSKASANGNGRSSNGSKGSDQTKKATAKR